LALFGCHILHARREDDLDFLIYKETLRCPLTPSGGNPADELDLLPQFLRDFRLVKTSFFLTLFGKQTWFSYFSHDLTQIFLHVLKDKVLRSQNIKKYQT